MVREQAGKQHFGMESRFLSTDGAKTNRIAFA
jgi:hypothetical protein